MSDENVVQTRNSSNRYSTAWERLILGEKMNERFAMI